MLEKQYYPVTRIFRIYLFFLVLEFELRALDMLDMRSTTELYAQPFFDLRQNLRSPSLGLNSILFCLYLQSAGINSCVPPCPPGFPVLIPVSGKQPWLEVGSILITWPW